MDRLTAQARPIDDGEHRGLSTAQDTSASARQVELTRRSWLQRLRSTSSETVFAPAFDHARKDPDFDAIAILPQHRLVLIEGLYVCRSDWPAHLLDERWLLDTDPALARQRLIARHLSSGIVTTEDEAVIRADGSDAENWRRARPLTLADRHFVVADDASLH